MTTPQPIQQYDYESAHRVSLATQETAPGLADAPALQEQRTDFQVDTANLQWPLLTWRDKDQNPSTWAGSLFIHEKVSPAQIVAGLMKDPTSQQMDWFHDFNNLPQDAHFEPYQHHQGNWSNRLIRGASQRVMSSLLNKEGMSSQVDLVYMDPPYGINFRSNFQPLADDPDVGEDWDQIPQDLRQVQAFRDAYKDGIHSYLSQLRTNILLAKDLLKETGSFVLQIGPENLAYATLVLDEVFGHENQMSIIPYITSIQAHPKVPDIDNWLIWYSKNKPLAMTKINKIFLPMTDKEKVQDMAFAQGMDLADGTEVPIPDEVKENPALRPKALRLWDAMPLLATNKGIASADNPRTQPWTFDPEEYTQQHPSYPKEKKTFSPSPSRWRIDPKGINNLVESKRVAFRPEIVMWKRYIEDRPGKTLPPIWLDAGRVYNKRYAVETPPRVLERVIILATNPGDLVLDPTCGSGAMPIQCERWGRRWIAIDSGATSIAIARERIATAVHPYHLLKDSPHGHRQDHNREQDLYPESERKDFYGNYILVYTLARDSFRLPSVSR